MSNKNVLTILLLYLSYFFLGAVTYFLNGSIGILMAAILILILWIVMIVIKQYNTPITQESTKKLNEDDNKQDTK